MENGAAMRNTAGRTAGVRGLAPEAEADRCCGRCRHSRRGPGESELRCMRHKIMTGFVCRCREWERRNG